MEVILNVVLFAVSLSVLLKASDWFVDSAELIGLSLGVSPFFIGITVVAFGTSLPELATSIAAVYAGNSEVVVGNVIGSNITNIALILGITAFIVREINMEYNIWHVDIPYLWASAFLLWFVLRDQQVSFPEILILLAGIIVFLLYSIKSTGDNSTATQSASWKNYLLLVVGGILVWLGANFTIQAITVLSTKAGISPEIIALSAVAIGTSLPELVVSITAARKGKAAIAVGNVLGSNVFNSFIVLGIPGLLGDLKIPDNILEFYLPLMLALTILFGIIANNKQITRWEGAILLLFYVLFLVEIAGG